MLGEREGIGVNGVGSRFGGLYFSRLQRGGISQHGAVGSIHTLFGGCRLYLRLVTDINAHRAIVISQIDCAATISGIVFKLKGHGLLTIGTGHRNNFDQRILHIGGTISSCFVNGCAVLDIL